MFNLILPDLKVSEKSHYYWCEAKILKFSPIGNILPSLKYIARDVWDKTWSFMKRAGTIILLCSVAIWVLVSFDWTFTYGVNVENSILADIGNLFAWVFYI